MLIIMDDDGFGIEGELKVEDVHRYQPVHGSEWAEHTPLEFKWKLYKMPQRRKQIAEHSQSKNYPQCLSEISYKIKGEISILLSLHSLHRNEPYKLITLEFEWYGISMKSQEKCDWINLGYFEDEKKQSD